MNSHNFRNFHLLLTLLVCLCSSCGWAITSGKLNATPPDNNSVAQADDVGSSNNSNKGQVLPITAQASIAETIFDLEVARTSAQQSMGLMFRDALPDNRGMYFPFPEARIARFWMNNVPVSLDMIFLREGRVVTIADSVPPCNTNPEDCPLYGPDEAVDGVIELRAGRANELELAVGDLIKIRYLDTLQQN